MRYDAYLFDVQGTLLDFFEPVHAAVSDHLETSGRPDVDAAEFTRAWRAEYFRRVAALRQTTQDWTAVAQVYAEGLTSVGEQFGLTVAPGDAARLAGAWQRLTPWPDVAAGLARIRRGALTATLSNTDMSTMVRLFKALGIDWDAILTAEIFGAFKPEPLVYTRALRYLGVAPERAAMVAAHPYDLRAASEVGMHTVFVYRPLEFGSEVFAVDATAGEFDHRVTDIGDIP